MSRKYISASIIVLISVALSVQSFLYYSQKKQTTALRSYFKAFTNRAPLCVPLIDTVMDISALKGWGSYQWKISNATDSAQFYFNQGINMYYAFHSIEAIASFTRATHLDPQCAMAWYGKALAMGPNINYPNAYRAPSEALEAAIKSKELSEKCTSLEKDLINAIQKRYSADTTISVKQIRTNYADAMQLVYEKHKTNADVVTLYADALLLLHPWDLYYHDFKPKPWTPKIRSLLEEALALSPKNPGANHYYIHTMEASATPGLALKSAHLLDTLMPGVSHVTHMPSHIYIRTGDYQRGIKNNDAAVADYNAYLKQYAPVINNFPLYLAHNMHMKINCAQMAGNYRIAMDEATDLQRQLPAEYLGLKNSDGNMVQYLYAQPAFTNVRFGKWAEIIKMPLVDTLPFVSVLQHFARGMAYSRLGNLAMAKRELNIINNHIEDKTLKIILDNFNSPYETCNVARLILKGAISEQQKQYDTAISYYTKAVGAEDNLIYNEPRDWQIPARQYLGNLLIKTGKYNQAIAVLNKDLVINPNNGWSLTGLQQAYQYTNNTTALKSVKLQLKNAWKIKDMSIQTAVF